VSADWRSGVLKFWFALGYDRWWKADETLDHRIREQFLKLWSEKRQLPADAFLADPLTALAAVILFDQFPRNMFRGHADQFSTDHLALEIAKGAIQRGFDGQLQADERAFLYMPFQHSEKMDDQNRSVLLFSEIGEQRYLSFAEKHRAVIERFGRFPHRNAMLGRAPRPEEIAAGDVFPW